MRIKLTSIMVDDQDKALAFYTDVLGLREEARHPGRRVPVDHGRLAGGARRPRARRWSRTPTPPRKTFQEAMFAQGIPLTAFEVDRHRRRVRAARGAGRGVHPEPTDRGGR